MNAKRDAVKDRAGTEGKSWSPGSIAGRFLDLKTRTKLLAGFLVVTALSMVVGVVSVQRINQVGTRSSSIYHDNVVPLNDLASLSKHIYRARRCTC